MDVNHIFPDFKCGKDKEIDALQKNVARLVDEVCGLKLQTEQAKGSAGFTGSVARHWVETFICELIDHCEGDTITEEYLQARYAEFLKKRNPNG